MNLEGEKLIKASQQAVWEALNDPEILARCVEGCERLEPIESNRFAGDLKVQVGPIRAKFSGEVLLKDIDAPNSYTLVGSGKGGPSGFASGEARVRLIGGQDSTLLKYTVEAKVGGKLAQIGGKLIENTARQHAEKFFEALKQVVEPPLGTRNDEDSRSYGLEPAGQNSGKILWPIVGLAVFALIALAWALS